MTAEKLVAEAWVLWRGRGFGPVAWAWLWPCGVGVASALWRGRGFGKLLSALMLQSRSTASRETRYGITAGIRQRRWVLTRAAASGGDGVLSSKTSTMGVFRFGIPKEEACLFPPSKPIL